MNPQRIATLMLLSVGLLSAALVRAQAPAPAPAPATTSVTQPTAAAAPAPATAPTNARTAAPATAPAPTSQGAVLNPRSRPGTTNPTRSPAERLEHLARIAIEKDAKDHAAHTALAMALARRARETSDTDYYGQAENALQRSLELKPDNFEALRARTWIRLGRHDFPEARKAAEALLKRVPDDLMAYALLTDAHIELGNYQEAETAAQHMMDLRPGTVPGLTRGAYLRELFGDVEGAIELMRDAFARLPFSEPEERAWILTHVAHLELGRGGVEAAERLVDEALALFPNYHYALSQMAKVRAAQGKHEQAADLLDRHVKAAPHPENFFYYAEALRRAGREAEAKAAFAEFEAKARAEMDTRDNANRELIFYYADHASNAPEAVRIARQEMGWRQDLQTRAAYAWALHKNGDNAEARKQIEAALAVGVKDAVLLYRAGVIRAASGDAQAAAGLFGQSLQLNPTSEVAAATRAAAARMPSTLPATSPAPSKG